jgi:uroporphyrinogen III methyltransferase/synthase
MAVRWATRPDQETVTGTLATLPAKIAERGLKPPATIVVGEVVALREKLDWFGRLPLSGRRIVVTRAREQADALSARLRELGADAIELPTIEIRPPSDPAPLERAIAELGTYDWLIFTSANGVRHFVSALDRSPADWRSLRAKICAIGPATRAALEALHLKVDLMGAEYVAEGLVEAFAPYDLAGKRVLLPRVKVARDLVPVELAKRGAEVDVVEAYQTAMPAEAEARGWAIFSAQHKPDWVTVTSSSTARNLVSAVGKEALAGVRIASIGPVTSRTVRDLGLEVAAEAKPYTVDALVEVMLRVAAGSRSSS